MSATKQGCIDACNVCIQTCSESRTAAVPRVAAPHAHGSVATAPTSVLPVSS